MRVIELTPTNNMKEEKNYQHKILVVWKSLKVGGIVGGWRNRSSILSRYGIQTEFLFFYDRGGADLLKGVTTYHITNQRDKVIEIIKEGQYDCIIVIDFNELYSILAEVKYTGPIIIESRMSQAIKIKKELRGFNVINPTVLVVASKFQKSLVSKYLPKKIPIEVIPNSLDTQTFKPMEKKVKDLDPPNNKKIIAWVGRISKGKNWRLFLNIAIQILRNRNDVHFWLISSKESGSQLRILKKKLKLMGFNNHLSWFHHKFSYKMMPAIYTHIANSGGTLLSTSKRESFGNVFLEAMICKCPVVAPNHTAIPEIITHGQTGQLYNLKRKESAIQELNKILDYEAHRKGIVNAAYNHVKENYGSEGINTLRYVNLIKKIVSKG